MIPSGVVRGRKNPLYSGFGQRLKRARRSAKLSHAALARRAGLGSRTTTALLENGERIPRLDTVDKLATALGLSPSSLAFGLDSAGDSSQALRYEGLPARLTEARLARGLSLRELGRRADASGTLVQQTERGRNVPTLATLEQLAKALAVSPAWLGFGQGPMIPRDSRHRKSALADELPPQPSS